MSETFKKNGRSRFNEHLLRKTADNVLSRYTGNGYVFNTVEGAFADRLIKKMKSGKSLHTSVYLTLLGCYCESGRLTIPCMVRAEIQSDIVRGYST